MKIATKTGDNGETSLLFGKRVPKSKNLIKIVGGLDELSANIGHAKVFLKEDTTGLDFNWFIDALTKIQNNIIGLMGEIATEKNERPRYISRFDNFLKLVDMEFLDGEVEHLEQIPELEQKGWVIYGNTEAGSRFDLACKVCRRVETMIIENQEEENFRPLIKSYINRLSDMLYLYARYFDFVFKN